MQQSSSAGVAVDYHFWATGVPETQRQRPPPRRTPAPQSPWERLPQAWHDEYTLHGDTIEKTLRAQANWHFRDYGQGAMQVRLVAGGNVVIALTASTHSDLNGYYIVLDDDNHESYVLKVNRLGNNSLLKSRLAGNPASARRGYARVVAPLYTDPTFRFDFTRDTLLWVMYRNGAIVVGEGGTVGSGRIILAMQPEPARSMLRAGNDLYHYGFAKLGNRWRGGIHIKETQALAWKDRSMPMPLPDPPTPEQQQAQRDEDAPQPTFFQWLTSLLP